MAVSLPFPHVPPIWLEAASPLEGAALMRSDVWSGYGVPAGEGRPVLLIPGFLAGRRHAGDDGGLAHAHGWRTKRAGFRANVACSQAACERLEERLEELAAETGARVTIIGQSRGGMLARALGARRPDLVSGIVTLGSPVLSQLAVHPLVLAQVLLVGAMGTAAFPGCSRSTACAATAASRSAATSCGDFPPEVGYVARLLAQRRHRRLALVPRPRRVRHVEIPASHCGMSLNQHAYRAVAVALGAFADYEDGLPRAAQFSETVIVQAALAVGAIGDSAAKVLAESVRAW